MERYDNLSDDEKKFFNSHVFPQPALTAEQTARYNEFATRVADIETDESALRRYLRARAYVVEAAEDMIRKEREWQANVAPKKCLNETLFRHLLFKSIEVFPNVRDVHGRPLIVVSGRYFNPALTAKEPQLMGDYFIWIMEIIKRVIIKPQAQFVLILDLDNWGLKNFDAKVSSALAEIAKPYYPDYMGQTFIINYSWVIWGVWKLAKMLLDQRTQEKVQFLSAADAKKLFPVLFDKDQIYERFGGTVREPVYAGTKHDEWNTEAVAKWNQIKASSNPEEAFRTAIDELVASGDIPKDKLELWLPLQSREALDQIFTRS